MTRKIKNTPSEDIESVDAPEITFKKVDNPKKMDAEKTKAYLTTGESKADDNLDPLELATYSAMCHILLNLDETITRE